MLFVGRPFSLVDLRLFECDVSLCSLSCLVSSNRDSPSESSLFSSAIAVVALALLGGDSVSRFITSGGGELLLLLIVIADLFNGVPLGVALLTRLLGVEQDGSSKFGLALFLSFFSDSINCL